METHRDTQEKEQLEIFQIVTLGCSGALSFPMEVFQRIHKNIVIFSAISCLFALY